MYIYIIYLSIIIFLFILMYDKKRVIYIYIYLNIDKFLIGNLFSVNIMVIYVLLQNIYNIVFFVVNVK